MASLRHLSMHQASRLNLSCLSHGAADGEAHIHQALSAWVKAGKGHGEMGRVRGCAKGKTGLHADMMVTRHGQVGRL